MFFLLSVFNEAEINMLPFDFPPKRQGAWGKLCFHLHPWDRARSSITWPQHHSFPSLSPTIFQKRQFLDSGLSKDYLERPALQGSSSILQGRAIPMAIISSSSTAVLPIQSPHFEQIWPQWTLFPTSCRHLLFYSLWNYDGSPAILAFEQATEANVNLAKHYCQKALFTWLWAKAVV